MEISVQKKYGQILSFSQRTEMAETTELAVIFPNNN